MKLIVDISPEDHEYLKSYREFYDTSEGRILKAVCNGKDAMAVIDGDKTKNVRGNRATELLEHISALFTKEEVIAMLTELRQEIDMMSDAVVEGRTVTITSWKGMQKKICDLVQSKINSLKENKG